jgi:hypothetical protein
VLPDVIVSQGCELVPDQVHVDPVVSESDPEPPAAGAFCVEGDSEYEQAVTPTCVMVTVRPATVSVPDRVPVAVLAATAYPTAPFPLPLAVPVSVSHELLLEADHEHPAPAVTETVPLPPDAAADASSGETPNEQVAENMKGFDTPLVAEPPGPTAVTRDSYAMPPLGSDDRLERLTRMNPSPCGVGLPSDSTWKACGAPGR